MPERGQSLAARIRRGASNLLNRVTGGRMGTRTTTTGGGTRRAKS